MKIVVCGPPHSGKSVFVSVLTGLLPRELYMLVEGAPDGEGITGWSSNADPALVKQVRHKGKFLPEFVNWVVRSINTSTAPITIVDVGGRRSPENERIFKACDHFIVISSNPEETLNWIEFGTGFGLKPLAVLDSVLEGTDEIYDEKSELLKARISNLDRNSPPRLSITAKAVAGSIIEKATALTTASQVTGSEQADVNFVTLASELNVAHTATGDVDWHPSILPKVIETLLPKLLGMVEVKLWGNMPAGFPYHALACEISGALVRYYDPKLGFVPLYELEFSKEPNQFLNWRVQEAELYTLVEFTIPGQIFDVFHLPLVKIPAATMLKGIIVSGKGPWWLTGAIARSYFQKLGVGWIAIFAPRESGRTIDGHTWSELNPGKAPAIIIASREPQMPVGKVIAFDL